MNDKFLVAHGSKLNISLHDHSFSATSLFFSRKTRDGTSERESPVLILRGFIFVAMIHRFVVEISRSIKMGEIFLLQVFLGKAFP